MGTYLSQDILGRNFWALIIAGVMAGIVSGVVLQDTGRMTSVAQLYGADSVWIGWLAHLVHSLVIALAFGVITSIKPIHAYADGFVSGAGFGVAFAVVLWIVGVSILIPLWLGLFFGINRPFPYFHWISLVTLVLYGAILGGLSPLLRGAATELTISRF